MSSNFGDTNAWYSLLDLTSKVKGADKLSNDELKKILKKSDIDDDGIIQLEEFKSVFLSSEEYAALEDEFLNAFDGIANLDGDSSSISETDIKLSISDNKQSEASTNTDSVSGASGGSYGYSNNNNVGATDLSSKTLEQLNSERSNVLSGINDKRNEKSQALSNANVDVKSKQIAYNEATKTFNELVQAKLENGNLQNEYANEVSILEDQKNAVNNQISQQETTISETNNLISSLSGSLSSLEEPPQTISILNEDTQENETQENPAYDKYLAQKVALENELAIVEADLAKQEDELNALKEELIGVENSLSSAIEKYVSIEEQAGNLSQEEMNAKAAIEQRKAEYEEARSQVQKIEQSYDKEIDELQASLISYNDAVTEKELSLPDGFSSENGEITDGKTNLIYLGNNKIPDGCNVVDGKIVDKDNKIVGYATGEGSASQLYLIEEKEPESVGYAQTYYLARTLFEESVSDGAIASENSVWNKIDFSTLSSKDVELMKDLYNAFVTEYNNSLQGGEKEATVFEETAKEKLSADENTKVVYETITTLLNKAENKIVVSKNNFENYLKSNNVNLATATKGELSTYLDKFINEKYNLDYNEEYYPSISEEQIEKYIGQGGLDELKDADDSSIKTKISKILNDDTITPYEQIQLVNTIKSYNESTEKFVNNYLTNDDSYFHDTLNAMLSNKEDFSSDDVLEFIRQYKSLDNTSSIYGANNEYAQNQEYMQSLLSLYESTDSPEKLDEIKTYIGTNTLLDYVQENYNDDDSDIHIQNLFTATIAKNISENGILSTSAKDYNIDDETATSLKDKYLKGNSSNSDVIDKILNDVTAGNIKKSEAQYLISNILGGKPENITEISSVNNNAKISELFNLFSYSEPNKWGKFGEGTYINDGTYQYMVMGPENVDPNESLPVIVFLGGGGEFKNGAYGVLGHVDSNNNGVIEKNETKYNAIGTILSEWDLEDFNGYIIAPSLTDRSTPNWANEDSATYIRGILEQFSQTHNVDSNQVFVGGHSLGGIGALYMAEHADDIFSKAFVMSAYDYFRNDINNVDIPMIGFAGRSGNSYYYTDSGYMESTFKNKVGEENFVVVDGLHGSVPVHAFNRDADGNGRSDIFEWLLEDKPLAE